MSDAKDRGLGRVSVALSTKERLDRLRSTRCRRGDHTLSSPHLLPPEWCDILLKALSVDETHTGNVADLFCMVCQHTTRRLTLWLNPPVKNAQQRWGLDRPNGPCQNVPIGGLMSDPRCVVCGFIGCPGPSAGELTIAPDPVAVMLRDGQEFVSNVTGRLTMVLTDRQREGVAVFVNGALRSMSTSVDRATDLRPHEHYFSNVTVAMGDRIQVREPGSEAEAGPLIAAEITIEPGGGCSVCGGYCPEGTVHAINDEGEAVDDLVLRRSSLSQLKITNGADGPRGEPDEVIEWDV